MFKTTLQSPSPLLPHKDCGFRHGGAKFLHIEVNPSSVSMQNWTTQQTEHGVTSGIQAQLCAGIARTLNEQHMQPVCALACILRCRAQRTLIQLSVTITAGAGGFHKAGHSQCLTAAPQVAIISVAAAVLDPAV